MSMNFLIYFGSIQNNIDLVLTISASASVNVSENFPDLTISANATITTSYDYILDETLTLSVIAGADPTLGVETYEKSLTIEADASIILDYSVSYDDTLTLSADTTLSLVAETTLENTLTVSAVSDFSIDFTHAGNLSLSISAVASITRSGGLERSGSLTLSSIASLSLIGGFEFLDTLELDAIASTILLPGTGYSDTLTLTVDLTVTAIEVTQIGNVLTIAAVADFALTNVLEPGGLLTISAVGSVTLSTLQDYEINLPISAIAIFFPEDIFDFVTSQGDAQASLTAAHQYIAGAPFTASVTAGVSVSVDGIYNKSITDSIIFTEQIVVQRPIIKLTDSISFIDTVTVKKIVTHEFIDNIVFDDEAFRIIPVIDSITFTDNATAYKVIHKNLIDNISFTDVLNRTTILNLLLTDNIVFAEGKLYNSPLNGTVIAIPGVAFSLIHGKCEFILTVAQRAILLPCPLWNDQQNFLGQVTIKKTLNGDLYSYIKQTDLRKLQYVFQVDTQKRIELYDFLKNFSADYITIDNHKGERWKAQLVNNPFQFDSRNRWAPRREQFDVTLEFEGVRIG